MCRFVLVALARHEIGAVRACRLDDLAAGGDAQIKRRQVRALEEVDEVARRHDEATAGQLHEIVSLGGPQATT
jgi:hypothetical protein